MTKIKSIHLKNYCGYRDIFFDFTGNNQINKLAMFVGPNGSGKSNLLEAIQLLSAASRFSRRDMSLTWRKYTYDPDYNPTTQEYTIAYADHIKKDKKGRIVIDNTNNQANKMPGLETHDPEFLKKVIGDLEEMEITGVFSTNDGDKEVIVTTRGVKKNELSAGMGAISFDYFIDADNPNNMAKFQLPVEKEKMFIDLAETIYGYKCSLEKKVNNIDGEIDENGNIVNEYFFTDCVLTKPWGDRVHFKRMSDGEKKIATLIRHLCDPTYMEEFDLILIDNSVMHVYAKRHRQMIKKILDTFPDKQFIMTTHSSILIDSLPSRYLYDVEDYKIKEAKKMGIKLIYPDSQSKQFTPSFKLSGMNAAEFKIK
jgi:AAA15 family ATPase/GTPase